MDTTESYMGVLGEIDVWDGLDDVDLEQSTSYNALDNEHRAHECSEAFSTNEVFRDRDELLDWARSVGYSYGFVIVILRSDTWTGQRGRMTYVLLGCERGGKYRRYKKEVDVSQTGSRKCECPFRLRGKPVKGGQGWKVELICGSHNHDLAETMVGHPYAGRLSIEEKVMVEDMSKTAVKPRNILLTMKERNEKNVTTIKQVYNAITVHRRSQRGHRTEMQQLMLLLERDRYVHWCRCDEVSNIVQDIFWTHPDSVKLVNSFNIVILMDSTYKTKKYRMPLLEVVGITSTGLTFSVAFCLLAAEKENNFFWALDRLKGLFLRVDSCPRVVVCDRDVALMNAIRMVFPEAYNLLCRFHIDKNVKAKCKMLVHPREAWDQVMEVWGSVVDCDIVEAFEDRVNALRVVCSPWPIFVDYVMDTWLRLHKEKFVKAWIDKVMHLGNTTSNRVESAHWSLKRVLQNSMGDLCFCWDSINKMIILQHNAIKDSFQKSLHVVGHRFKVTAYKKLLGFVSKYALNLISEELDRVKSVGFDKSRCGCSLTCTHGLPCACQLASIGVGSIPLKSVHVMWTRLSFEDIATEQSSSELSIDKEFEVIAKRFKELDVAGKVNIKSKLQDIAFPEKTSIYAPDHKVKTKGAVKMSRPTKFMRSTKRIPSYFEHVDFLHSQHDSCASKKFNEESLPEIVPAKCIPFLDQFPVGYHPYIVDVVDVRADGHCGYRAVAAQLGMGEESWAVVRMNLLKELKLTSSGTHVYGTNH
ncbi:protein FAR1-RELATED SEQUENCE 6-like [Phaseolus vulgaris]|uniref:protein FAR1-RELATED SEQUENCE 6-like n=1 Tax=Phaseolus vulgaris TaxID=3885 RepID=UPI0035CA0318